MWSPRTTLPYSYSVNGVFLMDKRRDFWNERSKLGREAGSPDLPLKRLETEAIHAEVLPGLRVLDVGCGNGLLAVSLAEELQCSVVGLDYAESMVDASKALAASRGVNAEFRVADIRDRRDLDEHADVVVTERLLINLDTQEEQHDAILKLARVGGLRKLVLCESSHEGNAELNLLRSSAGLPQIVPPWHNLYLKSAVVSRAAERAGLSVTEKDFSSSYYFASRILNALVAQSQGAEPSYDDDIPNMFDAFRSGSSTLGPTGRTIGQTRIWVLERCS